jgi:superfamily I DNA/RNA helicase
MTRARDMLWISCAGTKNESRFLDESGIERTPTSTFAPLIEAKKKERKRWVMETA